MGAKININSLHAFINLTILILIFFDMRNKNIRNIYINIIYRLYNLGIRFGLFDIRVYYYVLRFSAIIEDLKDLIYYYYRINITNYLFILLLSTNLIVYSYIY